MQKAWKIWLGLAIVLTALYYIVPNSAESKLVLYNGLGLLSIMCLLLGVRMHKPEAVEPWMWFGAGLTSFLTADVIYYILDLAPEGAPFPSIADFFYLMMYPLVIVGLTKTVRAVQPGRDATSFLDAAVVGISMFGALWVLFVDTVVATEGNTFLVLSVSLAYPVMDVALLAVAARLVVTVHLNHPPFAFVVAAIGSLAIADVLYNIALNSEAGFATGTYVDAFWLFFYVGFATAALHPKIAVQPMANTDPEKLTGTQLSLMFIASLGVPAIDLLWGNRDDRLVTITASALLFLLILFRVFTLMKAIERGQDRLRHDAEHDALTGLSNRVLFADNVETGLSGSRSDKVTVLFIDLDDFKTVNDSLGHQAGDELLAEVATRLGRCVKEEDTVARFGGDEFAVLLTSAEDRRDIVNVARRVLDELAAPFELDARTVTVSASIGIATNNEGNTDVESLLRNADVAMYLSKARGKGRFEMFESEMHEEAIERLDLKGDLQDAVDGDQFFLEYQPIFDLETGQVALVEALIRWDHPIRGLIQPERFIHLAEENNLIIPIGQWVLREACIQARKWQDIPGLEELGITVNLSVAQLQDGQLINSLTRSLKDSGLAAKHLVLEITESMLAVDADRSAGILEQIKTTGVKLAIDDFGTGYSSLSYLRSFPVDSIKIDRSFINELHRSATSTALIEAVVNLSSALGAYTVAEGIEHADQAALLRKLGCDRGQGFYYCRPLDAPALTTLLREHNADDKEPLEAWRRSAETVQQRKYDVNVRRGLAEIEAVASDIERLNDGLSVPLMGTWAWLHNWAEAFTNWTPMMVEVRAADTQNLVACALLATSQRAEGTAIVAMGHGSSLFTSLQATDSDAAATLAGGVSDALKAIEGVWSLDLEQIQDFDPVLLHLADELDYAQLLPELRIPRVVFSSAHSVNDVLSKSMRKQLRRANNKIVSEGLDLRINFDRGRAITPALIDEVESVHVSRDRDARRNSDLDRPAEREFWRRVVEGGSEQWEVEIATLRLDGELAAYVVSLLDGETYRVYDGRMSTKWQDYSPGRIVEAAALSRAISDPRFSLLDWMSGIAAEKLLTTNIAEGRARLVATSGSRYLGGPSKPKPSRKRVKVSAE